MRDEPLTKIDGRKVTRVPCISEVQIVAPGKWTGYPYVSNRLPTTIKGCKMVKSGSRLKPLIESERHEKKVMAMNDLVRDGASTELD